MKTQRILEGVQDSPATPSMRKWGDTFLPSPTPSHGGTACPLYKGSFEIGVDSLLVIGPEELPPIPLVKQVIF